MGNSASGLQQHLQTRVPALPDGERRLEEQAEDLQLEKDGGLKHGTRVCGELHHCAGIVVGKYQGASISHCQPGWKFAFLWWRHPDCDSYKQTGERGCNKEAR